MVLRRIRIEDELRRVWIELYLYKDTPVMRNERQGYGRHILLEANFRFRFSITFFRTIPVKPRKFEGGESESRERSIDHVNS